MLQVPQVQTLRVVHALRTIRTEWQEAAGTASLLDVESNLGMLLADVINHLDLATDLQVAVLGQDLFQEMKDLLKTPSQN